ncbi:MAG: hypothetical protein LBS65_01885 [Desulfovibrio sp.]|jgi:hypothetical protein|nr:hypothetical protein [Desulfovibrio sp.]
MVTNRPVLGFQGSTNPDLADLKRKSVQAKRREETFAAFLPGELSRADKNQWNSARVPGLNPAQAAGVFPVPQAAYPAANSAQGKTGQIIRNTRPGNSAFKRPSGLVRRIPAEQPITGRGDIGMVDTRKIPADSQNPAQGTQRDGQPAQPSFVTGRTNDLSRLNLRGGPLSGDSNSFLARGFASKNAELALRDLGYRAGENRGIETRATLLDPVGDKAGAREISLFEAAPDFARGKKAGNERFAETAAQGPATPQRRQSFPEKDGRFVSDARSGQDEGALAAKFESGEDGVAAVGYDGTGGTSYGKFQIASRPGTMRGFLSYLKEKAPEMAKRLLTAGPADTGGKSGRMPAEWRKIADETPALFERLQSDFIRATHVEPATEAISQATGINFRKLPQAFREVLFSTAVQHGPAGAARIISQAARSVNKERLINGKDKNGRTDQTEGRKLITQIYNIRAGQFSSSSSEVRAAVRNRLRLELREALDMLS